MNCQDFQTAYLAGEADSSAPHILGCANCRAVLPNLDLHRSMLVEPDMWEEPPDGLEDRIALLTAGRGPTITRREPARWRLRIGAAAAGVAAFAAGFFLVSSRAPDWKIEAIGTDLAPTASAVVSGWNTDAGTRLVLDIDGLDPAPEAQVYEIWLSRGPVHVSAGTFRTSGHIETTVGVARRDYPRIWITLEPEDEDAAPSGRTVIDTEWPR